MIPALLVAGAVATAAFAARANAKPTSQPLAVWMARNGVRSLGSDVPLAAILRARIYDLNEVPEAWTRRHAYGVALHRDFRSAPGNYQGALGFNAPDHSIAIVRPLMPRTVRTPAGLRALVRHELWHTNNRAADASGDPFHEQEAAYFGAHVNGAVGWAEYPPGKKGAVR